MTQDYLVRSQLALKAVRLDRQKFNDAVSKGFYPCAPGTTQGRGRFFNMCELLVLWVFARLLDLGLSSNDAGGLACGMSDRIAQMPDQKPEDVMVYIKLWGGPGLFLPGTQFDGSPDTRYLGGRRIQYAMHFYLATAREEIQQVIDEEIQIIGIEEEEQ